MGGWRSEKRAIVVGIADAGAAAIVAVVAVPRRESLGSPHNRVLERVLSGQQRTTCRDTRKTDGLAARALWKIVDHRSGGDGKTEGGARVILRVLLFC